LLSKRSRKSWLIREATELDKDFTDAPNCANLILLQFPVYFEVHPTPTTGSDARKDNLQRKAPGSITKGFD
jgi:hypothetical protein